MNILKIRAHHLLCLLAYKGDGYNEKFKKTFSKLREHYLKKDNFLIVTKDPDLGCEACPKSKLGICEAEGGEIRVNLADNEVIGIMKLETDTPYLTQDIWAKISKLTLDDLYKICNECSWLKKKLCPITIILNVKNLQKS